MGTDTDDVWAAMQAKESQFTASNRHRCQRARSLASLSKRVVEAHPKPRAALAYEAPPPCMTMPLFSQSAMAAAADLEIEPTVVTMRTKGFVDGEDEAAEPMPMDEASFAEQLERALTATARDLNMLTAPEKHKRKDALDSIQHKLLSPPLHATVIALALPHLVKPLLKRFEDPVEVVRDRATALLMQLLQASADIEQVLQYVLPVTLERLRPAPEPEAKGPAGLSSDNPSLAPKLPPELRSHRDLEESEEVRCQLLQLLRVCLVPHLTAVTAMQYLADLCGCIIRNCRHKAPCVAREAAGVCRELATVLWHKQYKCSILKPYCERLCLGLMYALYAKSAKVRAAAVAALRRVILCGETSLIQDMAAWKPPNHLDLTQYYHPRAKRNTLAHLAEDSVGQVRSNFYEMCLAICKEPYYAAEEDSRLIPYILSGTYDPLPELANRCVDIIEELGQHYESLNEQDFVDVYDYDGDAPYPGVVWKPPLSKRPGMGARLLVRSRVNKVLSSLCRELLDDNNSDQNRLKCARLLLSHVLYSEKNMTGDAPMLLKICLGAGGHPLLHSYIQPVLETLGHYLEPELYLPLCLPHMRKPDVGHPELARLLASIATMLRASVETENAAVLARDPRVGGLRTVTPHVMEEFVCEAVRQVYATSNNVQLRGACSAVLCWISGCPSAVGFTPLLFALVQARATAPNEAAIKDAGTGLKTLAKLSQVSDVDTLCRQEWSKLESAAIVLGVRARLMLGQQQQQQQPNWLSELRERLGMPSPPTLPVEPMLDPTPEDSVLEPEPEVNGGSTAAIKWASQSSESSAVDIATESFVEIDSDGEEVDPDDVAEGGQANAMDRAATFLPSSEWAGAYDRMYFGLGARGLGYYLDDGQSGAVAPAPVAPHEKKDPVIKVAIEEESDSSDGEEGTCRSDGARTSLLSPDGFTSAIRPHGAGVAAASAEEVGEELTPSPEDAATSQGLAGWFEEQLCSFRYDASYRERMVSRFGSEGDFQRAVRAVVDQHAKSLAGKPVDKSYDGYNPNGASEYQRAIASLNQNGDGPKMTPPHALACKLKGEPLLPRTSDWASEKSGTAQGAGHDPNAAAHGSVAQVTEATTRERAGAMAAAVEKLRQAGNEAMKAGQVKKAITLYSKALDKVAGAPSHMRDGMRVALHNNRCAANLQDRCLEAAVADASVVLELQPGNPKALFRRARAHRLIGGASISATIVDLINLVELQPSNVAAKKELARAKEIALQSGLVRRAAAEPPPASSAATGISRPAMTSVPIVEDSDDSGNDDD